MAEEGMSFSAILWRIAALLATLWDSMVSAVPDAWEWICQQWSSFPDHLDEWFPQENRPTVLQVCLWVLACWLFLCCCGGPLLACARCIWDLVVGCVTGIYHLLADCVLDVFHFLRSCFCCCCDCGEDSGRMMIAPGRGGARMLRESFEADPQAYFRDLRLGKPLSYSSRGPLLC